MVPIEDMHPDAFLTGLLPPSFFCLLWRDYWWNPVENEKLFAHHLHHTSHHYQHTPDLLIHKNCLRKIHFSWLEYFLMHWSCQKWKHVSVHYAEDTDFLIVSSNLRQSFWSFLLLLTVEVFMQKATLLVQGEFFSNSRKDTSSVENRLKIDTPCSKSLSEWIIQCCIKLPLLPVVARG